MFIASCDESCIDPPWVRVNGLHFSTAPHVKCKFRKHLDTIWCAPHARWHHRTNALEFSRKDRVRGRVISDTSSTAQRAYSFQGSFIGGHNTHIYSCIINLAIRSVDLLFSVDVSRVYKCCGKLTRASTIRPGPNKPI